MVKVECRYAFGVTTFTAFTTFVNNRHLLEVSSTFIDKKFPFAFGIAEPPPFTNLVNARFPRTLHRLDQN